MRIVKAFLVKMQTTDGLVEMLEESVRTVRMHNLDMGVCHEKEIVNALDGANWGWMPNELLRIEK